MRNIPLILLALSVAAASGSASAQSVKFTNVSPTITIPLATSSSVTIDTNGDVIASCATSGASCQGIPTGGGSPPTVSISGSTTNAQNNDGSFNVPITYTVTPTSSGSGNSTPEVCSRLSGPLATQTNGTWSGTSAAPLGASSLSLTAAGIYQFKVRCFSAGGAAEAVTNPITLVGVTQGGNCTPPAGFTQNAVTWNQLFGGTVQFPRGAPTARYFGTAAGTYLSVQFTVTSAFSSFNLTWDDNQQIGGTAATLHDFKFYVTISDCAGDFRLGVIGATDTSSYACKSIRRNVEGGALNDGYGGFTISNGNSSWSNSGAGSCGLTVGKTYYLNYINQDIRVIDTGGIWSNSTNLCNSPNCGVQIISTAP